MAFPIYTHYLRDEDNHGHVWAKCTMKEKGHCGWCKGEGMDCMAEVLSICTVCMGSEGSLLPKCPGRNLSFDEDQANYQHYCAGTGPFAELIERYVD